MIPSRNGPGFLTALLLTVWIPAWSESIDFEGERARIEAQRREQVQVLDALQQGCQTRFAVTDCVNRVRSQRRQEMAELDQRIAHINSAQRLEQAEQSRRNRAEKIAQRQQPDAQQATPVPEDAVSKPPVKASAPRSPSSANRRMDRAAQPGNTLDGPTRESKKARFLKKQQDAQERRQIRDQRMKEPVPAHLALPLPP